MANSNSVEFQVNLGLNAAQTQIDALRKALTEAVKVDSTAFKTIDTALSGAIRQVNRLRSEMNNAFKTSAGSNKFLKDYEKLFETLGSIGDRFNFLKESEMIFSPEATQQLSNYREELKTLQKDIEQIQSGKVGKIFNDSSIEGFKEIRDIASELKINLENTTFDSFKVKISDAMKNTQKEIEETTKALESLKAAANSTTLNKDSILNSFTSKNVGDGTLSSLISDSVSAKKLRDQISEAYKEFGISADSKSLGNSIRANANIANIFADQEKAVTDAADKLKGVLNQKKGEITVAWNELVKMRDTNRDASGNVVNWEEKLAKIEEIRNKFSELNISMPSETTATTGRGIKAYLDQIIQELIDGANNLKIEDFQNALRQKISEAINNATTKNVITDTKKFSDQVTTALTDIFGNVNFDINFTKFKGSTLDDAFSSIIASVQAKLKNTDTQDLENKVQTLKDKLNQLTQIDEIVNKTQTDSSSGFEEKKKRVEELTEAIANLLGVEASAIRGKITAALQEDGNAANQAKTQIENYATSLTKLEGKQKALSNVQSAVTRWMGFYQVLNLTKRAVNDMKQHIQELDSVMTKIAVVTNMTTNDLWNQISTYSEIARQYGVAIKGVYEVSQIYYQQGLNKGDVMGLTTETLKMARIAGIDYATAADYMTTAIRGFKLEMSDATHVTDVFSNLAAHTASSTEELAVAISKTAASAASVGASFEATSAMMATMIATTRESATNIGTALKSIIARYGELKQNMTGTDAEGEEYSLNKVDTALQSIGISIHNAQGEFRDFDDVILELGEKWNQIDKNAQRYIATVMAGNRQQSRFLALVSNVEEYKRALELANDSENAGELQTLKTLDSIDAKIERMKVTIQEFYTSSGIQDLYKGVLDTITNVINAANDLPKLFDKIPVAALAIAANLIRVVKNIATTILNSGKTLLTALQGESTNSMQGLVTRFSNIATQIENALRNHISKGIDDGAKQGSSAAKTTLSQLGSSTQTMLKSVASIGLSYLSTILSGIGAYKTIEGMNSYGSSTTDNQDRAAGTQMVTGGILGILGDAASGAASGALVGAAAGSGTGPGALVTGAIGAVVGALKGLVTNFATLKSGAEMLNVTLARTIELDNKRLENAKTEETKAKGTTNELVSAYEKLSALKDAAYQSNSALQEYYAYMNQLSDSYPELVTSIDEAGNSIITLTSLEEALTTARLNSASATKTVLEEELQTLTDQRKSYDTLFTLAGEAAGMDLDAASTYARGKLGAGDNSMDSTYAAFISYYNKWASQNGYQQHLIDQTWGGKQNNKNTILSFSDDFKAYYDWLEEQEDFKPINYIEKYKKALKDFQGENSDVSLSTLTGGLIKDSVDELDSLSTEDISRSIEETRKIAGDFINAVDSKINGVNLLLSSAVVSLGVERQLTDMDKNNELAHYSKLISFMIDSQESSDYNWDTAEGSEIIKARTKYLANWIELHKEDADWLLNNLEYGSYQSIEQLNQDLTDMDLDENAQKGFQKKYKTYRQKLQEQFSATLDGIFGSDRQNHINNYEDYIHSYNMEKLFNERSSDGTEVIGTLMPIVQNGLVEFNKLQEAGYTTAAENYYKNLLNTFTTIGKLDNKSQQSLTSILESVDFGDADALTAAAESIRTLGPEFEFVALELDNAANRLTDNISMRIIQIREATIETAKSAEKMSAQIGQNTKISDALDNVNTILENYSGDEQLTFTDLYQWDEILQGYVLSQKGISIWFKNINDKNNENINKAKDQLKELQSIYGIDSSEGILFDAETNLKQADVMNKIVELYTDENGNILVSEDYIDSTVDSFMATYELLKEEFSNQTDLNWHDFIQLKKDEIINQNEKWIKSLEELPQRELLSKLVSLDYKAIAGGTATSSTRETLEGLLQEAGVSEDKLGTAFNNIWADMLAGNFDSYNQLLTDSNINIKVSDTKAFAALQEEYKQYSEGLSEVLSSKPIAAWSEATKEIAGITSETDLTTVDAGAIALRFLQRISELVGLGAATIEEQEQSIINVMNQSDKEIGIGRQKQLFDSLKNGFTNEELVKLGGIDDSGNLKEELVDLIEKDNNTGDFKVIAQGSVAEILDQFAEALGITLDKNSDAYKEAVSSGIDEVITERAKNNTGKQIANQIQALSSAKVGDEVNISLLSSSMKQALGLDANAETLTIESEERRDALLLLLETSISEYEGAGKEALIATYNNIKSSITSKKGSQNSLVSGIVSSTVSKDTWKSYVANVVYPEIDINKFNEKDLQNIAFNRGYIWDEYTQQYRTTTKALETINKDIENAVATGAAPETIAELRKQAGELERTLTHDNKRDALTNLITNYQDAESYLSDFYGQFGYSKDFLKEQGILTEANGKSIINIDKLNELVDGYDDVFETIANQIADEYISNAQKAGTLFTQGTTSQVEIAGFKQAYADLTDSEVEFIFDPLLQAWTIDALNLRTYLIAISKTLDLDEQGQQEWVENQIKTLITDNLDFTNYLSGNNTTKDTQKLKKNLTNYFKGNLKGYDFTENIEEWAKSEAEDTLKVLSIGGQQAVNRLKSIKGDLTQDEIDAAYHAQIAPIKSVYEQLSELQVGSVVAKDQIDILNQAGFTVNADGVITSTGELVQAYKSLYDQMRATNEATVAELNTAYAQYLT